METLILSPIKQNIARCAEKIRIGSIVAFPTETVYGLGASAFNDSAVHKIYEAKGRPSDNPLIVHICEIEQMESLVKSITEKAKKLADAFMPGPLTLVLQKSDAVPKVVTGGLDTVAIRMPSHAIAREFIKECGVPICAPSANLSSRPSPTSAKHVFNDLHGRVRFILDGGECEIGLESTIVDLSGDQAVLLREGAISKLQLEKVIGHVEISRDTTVAKSPGMKYKHYAPDAKVYFSAYYERMHETIIELYDSLTKDGKSVVVMAGDLNVKKYGERNVFNMGKTNLEYAKNLFSSLRTADDNGYDCVIAEGVDSRGIGAGIINRLIKSSGGCII